MSIRTRPDLPRRLSGRGQERLVGAAFSLPAAVLIATFFIVPVVYGAWLSLHQWSGFNEPTWVGADNYRRLVTSDRLFRDALWNNTVFAVVSVVLRNVLGIALALLLLRLGRFQGFARTAVFIPATLSLVAVATLWTWIYNPNVGLVNSALDAVGLDALTHTWLGDTSTALAAVIAVDVWRWVGFHTVLYYVGIQALPQELFDAAAVDGAGPFRRLFSITLPLLTPVIVVNLVLSMAGAFVRNFDLVYVMTGGGPARSTEVVPTLMVARAFRDGELGYATAMGFVLFAIIALAIGAVVGLAKWRSSDV